MNDGIITNDEHGNFKLEEPTQLEISSNDSYSKNTAATYVINYCVARRMDSMFITSIIG